MQSFRNRSSSSQRYVLRGPCGDDILELCPVRSGLIQHHDRQRRYRARVKIQKQVVEPTRLQWRVDDKRDAKSRRAHGETKRRSQRRWRRWMCPLYSRTAGLASVRTSPRRWHTTCCIVSNSNKGSVASRVG